MSSMPGTDRCQRRMPREVYPEKSRIVWIPASESKVTGSSGGRVVVVVVGAVVVVVEGWVVLVVGGRVVVVVEGVAVVDELDVVDPESVVVVDGSPGTDVVADVVDTVVLEPGISGPEASLPLLQADTRTSATTRARGLVHRRVVTQGSYPSSGQRKTVPDDRRRIRAPLAWVGDCE